MFMQRRVLLLVVLGAVKSRAELDPVWWTDTDDVLPENTLMPNERQTLTDCHLRFYSQGGRGLVGPAFAEPAFLTEFAHIGAIGWTRAADGWIDWACGGSLIWSNFLVTAAHCTANDDNVPPDVVRFGDLDLQNATDDEFAQQLRIVNVIRHPLYRFSAKYYDIALLQLERSVTIHPTVAPACLWLDEEVRFPVLESAGWGQTGFGEAKTPILLKITLKPLRNENCSDHYRPTATRGLKEGLKEHHLCAGDAKMDTCLGDSGGPLHIRLQHSHRVTPFLVGLTSFGLPCGQSHPGVYTKLAPFRSWIVDTLQRNGAPEASDDQFEPQACALRYVGYRQLAISDVVANASGVFEEFDFTRQYITDEHMRQVVQLRWPATVTPERTDCMGSIIDHDTIVTLGDCAAYQGIPPTQVMHRVAVDYLERIEQSYDIEEIVVHPNHTEGSYYDNIAIVKINGSINVGLPACIWHKPTVPARQMEIFTVGRRDLNVYQHEDNVVFDQSSMRLTPRVYAYDNDNCTLAKQYRDGLASGLLPQHLCFANDPFLVPQVCDLTKGGPLQRNVNRLDRFYKYVYGLSLFGRDCGFGEPAVAVQLHAHLGWLESVLLPNRTQDSAADGSDAILYINPDLELFDGCDFHDGAVGVCVPVDRCRGVKERLRRHRGVLMFCTNATVVCCAPADVLDDSDLAGGPQQIVDCEQRYGQLRAKNYKGSSEVADQKPHLAEIALQNRTARQVKTLCLGYLITTGAVLTSAVCAHFSSPNAVVLGAIMSRLEDSTIVVPIESLLPHPEFDRVTGVNNVALVKLAHPIEPNVAVFPVCLWRNETHTPLVATMLSLTPDRSPAEHPVHPMYSSDCERFFERAPHPGQLCMTPEEHRRNLLCSTSAPVYWRKKTPGRSQETVEYLVAMYSHGECAEGRPFINTRVAAYLPWIIENV